MESVFSSFLKTPSSLLQRETAGGACEGLPDISEWLSISGLVRALQHQSIEEPFPMAAFHS